MIHTGPLKKQHQPSLTKDQQGALVADVQAIKLVSNIMHATPVRRGVATIALYEFKQGGAGPIILA